MSFIGEAPHVPFTKINSTTIVVTDVPSRSKSFIYPELFAPIILGRTKSQLSEVFGLANFDVKLTQFSPNLVQLSGTSTLNKMSSSTYCKVLHIAHRRRSLYL